MLFEPGNQPVNIDKAAVDTLQMHNIRLFFPYLLDNLFRGNNAAAVREAREAGKQTVDFPVKVAANTKYARFIDSLSTSIEYKGCKTVVRELFMQHLR